MIDVDVYNQVLNWIQSRGIPNTEKKHKENIHRLAANIVGELVVAAAQGGKTDKDVISFVRIANEHIINFTNFTGKPFEFDDLMSLELRSNYFYDRLRKFFLTARLGSVQCGDGEIALVLFSQDGRLLINNKKADVYVGGYHIQCKKIKSNNESEESLEEYQVSPEVDLMLMIAPDPLIYKKLSGSDTKGVTSRVWVYDTRETHWSTVLELRGKNGSLHPIHEL